MNYVPFFACACVASEPRRDLRLCAGAIPCSALLHIKFHAVEIGHIEVDELTGDVTVVCPERLACRHMGDDFALYNAFLVPFGSRGLDGDGVILKAWQHRGKLARGFGDTVAVLHAGLRQWNPPS